MRSSHAFLALALTLSAVFAQAPDDGDGGRDRPAQEPTWLTDLDAAKAEAAEAKRPILAYFTCSDCGNYCPKLNAAVFDRPEFADWAGDNVVLFKADFPRNTAVSKEDHDRLDALRKTYEIQGFPTVVLMDAEGNKIDTYGYREGLDVAGFITEIHFRMRAVDNSRLWTTDHGAAIKSARKGRKVVMAFFTGSDWCGWCMKLKAEVFDQPEFAEWVEDGVVPLELDFPRKTKLAPELRKQNEELAQRFEISGYPTVVFLDAKGEELGRTGYVEGGPSKWMEAAEKQMGKYGEKLRKKRLSRERKQAKAAKRDARD